MDVRGDFLVIGSGIAGLRAALTLAEAGEVIILTKADPGESNTGYAQGGIAAALGPDDSPALHAKDTIAAGEVKDPRSGQGGSADQCGKRGGDEQPRSAHETYPSTAVYIRNTRAGNGCHYPGGPEAGRREAAPRVIVWRDHRAGRRPGESARQP